MEIQLIRLKPLLTLTLLLNSRRLSRTRTSALRLCTVLWFPSADEPVFAACEDGLGLICVSGQMVTEVG